MLAQCNDERKKCIVLLRQKTRRLGKKLVLHGENFPRISHGCSKVVPLPRIPIDHFNREGDFVEICIVDDYATREIG